MATTKPRITITLEPHQHDVLRRLSDLQSAPMARIVSDLLSEVVPMLEKLVETLEVATRAHQDIRANLKRSAEQAEEELRPLAEQARNQFDLFSSQLKEMVEAREAAESAGPRPVITGATTPQRKPLRSSESASPGVK